MRVSRRQMSLVNDELRERAKSLHEDQEYRRETQRQADMVDVDPHDVDESLARVDPLSGGQLDDDFRRLVRRIESVSLGELSNALKAAGVRKCDEAVLGESLESSFTIDSTRRAVTRSLERLARRHCRSLVRETPDDLVGHRLTEVTARGIPEFAIREIASDVVESVRRLVRSNVQAMAQNPRQQREMISAGKAMLDDLEEDLIELLEDALENYVRKT